MEQYKIHRNILCVDLKSFYASVECVLRGLDILTTKLVVADSSRGGGSIVLSVSPKLKELGVPNVCRIFEIPTYIDGIIYAMPRMQTYLEYSAKIIGIYLSLISEEDIHVYSVDEAFLDVTEYLSYYNCTDIELANTILKKIKEETGLYATVGIGENLLQAKLALDIESKKSKTFIAKWTYEDIKEKLWPITKMTKMWSIGNRMDIRLRRLGFTCIGDIARSTPEKLQKHFGILGVELYYHTHGIDMSIIKEKPLIKPKNKSYGAGQMLFKDYQTPEVFTIMLEQIDEVTRRLRIDNKTCQTIHLGIGYSKNPGGGFARQITLDRPTANESEIYEACLKLFEDYYDGSPIRCVRVSLTKLKDKTHHQYTIFENPKKVDDEFNIGKAMDSIKMKYGKNAITRGSAELAHSTIKARNKMIGGHNA
ncbi:damage repair protein [Acholeplasma sp. OttesenSCG-928-E16]|nr:damage repair protein [Acholeplasma sp. OttesenSCG-928-E16]